MKLVKADDTNAAPIARYIPYTRHLFVMFVDRRAALEVKDEALGYIDQLISSYFQPFFMIVSSCEADIPVSQLPACREEAPRPTAATEGWAVVGSVLVKVVSCRCCTYDDHGFNQPASFLRRILHCVCMRTGLGGITGAHEVSLTSLNTTTSLFMFTPRLKYTLGIPATATFLFILALGAIISS